MAILGEELIVNLTITTMSIPSQVHFIKNAMLVVGIIPAAFGMLLACTSMSYNSQAQADIDLMKRYDALSHVLMGQIESVNRAIALDTANTDLAAKRESLLVRKMEVDYIREQARKSAIENAEKGARSSPINGYIKKY